ncbi:fimbrial protein [Providencia stuartii]|uniref:Fimbrial protein n=2 Tax=Providencia TaxID=586 RepID=A0AAI9MY87_PROST|nr:fimbrial protein [Providencia stuartii]ELR5046191.1 fimbrial protein [Providencia rettgeri]MTB38533.1 fimbrial protein [Providencia sp. wls1949]MTC08664.1 fimbrial protein [Providencia sp. wls1948]QIC17730.1 fimbrial protein [Providencia vermicola]
MMSIKYFTRLLLLGLIFHTPYTLGFSGYLFVEVRGEVLAKPCSINNGRAIEVDFGDVMTTRIEGDLYKQPLEYEVSCVGGGKPNLTLFVDGTPSTFDQRSLKTDVDGLAVLFKAGTEDLPIKKKRPFNLDTPPKLFAVLVKQSGVNLPARKFTANATLKVEYQ